MIRASNSFGDSETMLAKYIKNINIIFTVRGDDDAEKHQTVMDDILIWIRNFNDWYKSTLNIELSNQYHLYNRTILLMGSGLMRIAEVLPKVHLLAKEIGMNFCISLEINEYASYEQKIQQLIAENSLPHILLRIDDPAITPEQAEMDRLIEALLTQNIEVDFSGDMAYLLSLRFLDSDLLNAADASIVPNNKTIPDDPEFPISPCNNQLGIFIDASGHLYPCFPLMGVPEACLGSIHTDICTTVLGGKETLLDIKQLIHHGPESIVLGCDAANTPMHYLKKCRLHRQQLMTLSL